MEKDLGSKIDSHSSHDYHRREDKGIWNLNVFCLFMSQPDILLLLFAFIGGRI